VTYLRLFAVAVCAVAATAGVSNAQFTLIPNGDFAAGNTGWGDGASPGTVVTYETTGGAGGAADGYGRIDNTAGAWGGVLVGDGNGGYPLASLGLTAGQSVTIQWDMIELGSTGASNAGIKMESFDANGLINDSGDQIFTTTDSWSTFTYSYAIDPNATRIQFVPLNVGNNFDFGYDNVGFIASAIPEPSSLALIGLGLTGVVARRRRS